MKRIIAACMLCLYGTSVWAVSPQYVNPGTTPIIFADGAQAPNGGTWTLSNRNPGTGEVGARYDKGTGAKPAWWEYRCRFALTGTNVPGEKIELYISTSDGTNPDGEIGTGDGAISADKRRNLKRIGTLVVDQTTTNTIMTASGLVYIPQRYFSPAMWNATSLPTQSSTSAMRCAFTPMTIEMQ